MEELREEVGVKGVGSTKNGGAEGGSWCERGSHEEAGEEPAKVGWTCGQNGTVDEESGCA